MPGLTVILSRRPPEQNERELDEMLRSMLHEPFYNTGKYVDRELGVYICWTCHNGSFCDCMPISDENKEVLVFFAGEDFQDQTTITGLRERGHSFPSSLDGRYLAHLYEDTQAAFFNCLNGFFHGVVLDLRRREIRLFNDRYGMKRLYYHIGKDEFLFSSEAKTLLRIRPELRQVDPQGLGEVFSCGCVLNDRTLFRRVFTLPGGSVWTFRANGEVIKERYFKPEDWESQSEMHDGDFYPALRETLKKTVPRYLRANGRVCLSLTGGQDTRIILASIDLTPGSLPCFTFGGMYRDSYDVRVSRQVAAICRQPHYTLRLDRGFLNNFRAYAEKTVFISDGSMNVTGAPNIYVNSLATDLADVRLTGNYGQEVLRRYIAFRPNPPPDGLFAEEFLPFVHEARKTWTREVKGNPLTFALFKQAPWFQYGRFCVEDSQIVQRSPFMDNDLVRMVYRASATSLQGRENSWRIIKDGSPALARLMTDRGICSERSFPYCSMVRAGREVLFKIEYYFNNGLPLFGEKLNRVLNPLGLEHLFLGRNKYYHMRSWFRDELAGYLRDVLLDPSALSREFINGACLEKMVKNHIEGEKSHTGRIIACLSVELMHRVLVDRRN